jgi:hypothetical protein
LEEQNVIRREWVCLRLLKHHKKENL